MLTQKPHKNPFQTPENYFDSLEQSILEQTVATKPKVIPIYRQIWFWPSIAACLLIFILVLSPKLRDTQVSEEELTEAHDELYDLYLDDQDLTWEEESVYEEYVSLME